MRKKYLDNIRWATVALVVLYHVLYMFNAEGVLGGYGQITALEHQYYDLYLYIVYPWFMMLLFMVSGVCSRYYLDSHTGREFFRSRTVRLLVPSTVGLFVFQFLQGCVSMSLSGAFDTMEDVPGVAKYFIAVLSGTGVLWYIQLLWVFSAVLLLIKKIDKDRLWNLCKKTNLPILIALATLMWGAAQLLNTPVIIVYRFGLYGAAFLLGYFVFSHDEVIESLKKYFWIFLAIAVVLGTAFCIVYFGENYAEAPINRSPLFTSYGWFACLAVLGGAARYADFENGFTRWMGKRSFGLYVFHYLFISGTALFLAGKIPAPLVYLISAVAGFGGGYLLNEVISRIPVLRWCVLGIRKRK